MSVLQTVRNAIDTSTADGVKAQAQLYFLTNAATARLAFYEGQLALSLTDGGGDTPIKIVGDPIAYLQDYRCNVSSDPASGITDAVTADDVKQGFQALISAGPNTILGSTAMGQTEQVQTLSRPAFPTTRNDRSSAISRLATNPRGRPSRPSSGANAWKSRPNGGAEGRLPGEIDQFVNDGATTYGGPADAFVWAASDEAPFDMRPAVSEPGVAAIVAEVRRRGGTLLEP